MLMKSTSHLMVIAILWCSSLTKFEGQAFATADKSMAISTFGAYAASTPDVYTHTRPMGITAGVEVTRYFKGPLTPSFEARVNLTGSSFAAERTYLLGFRGHPKTFLKRVDPYGDILVGIGIVRFKHPTGDYFGDDSRVFSYGGGLDFVVANSFYYNVDYQKQHWNTGETITTPGVFTFGVGYRFPFRPRWNEKARR